MPLDYAAAGAEGKECPGIAGFIDVETTGLSPYQDEVIELALSLFSFERASGMITGIVDEYCGLREPGVPISSGALRVHGIRPEHVLGRRLDDLRIRSMFARAEFLVAHNASFDRGFVARLFPESAAKPWLCSMRGINWRGKGFGGMSLQRLLDAHGIVSERAHRADYDVKCAIRLLSCTASHGRPYFFELLEVLNRQQANISR